MHALCVSDVAELKAKIPEMRTHLTPKNAYAKSIYAFVFTLCLEEGQKQLPKELAI